MKKLRITVGNKSYDVTVEDLTDADAYPAPTPPPGPATAAPSHSPHAAPRASATRPQLPIDSGAVTSPMAGAIRSVLVKPGDTVKQGQPLVILEAMKMENQITAPVAGAVKSINVAEGESVTEGHVLVVLEEAMLLAQQNNRPLVDFTLAPLLEDHGIALAVMGMSVVFMALSLIVVFITLLPRVLAPFVRAEGESTTSLLPVDDDELSDEMLVVIAAAVAQVLDKPHRIVRIQGLTPTHLGWSLEGRMQHHQSHRIQQRARR